MIMVKQGEFVVSNNEEDVLTTVLGSCVAACLFDPEAKVGGMNHFLLPEASTFSSTHVVYGTQAMELLINGMMKQGGQKNRMQAKLFGGGRVIDGLSDVGASNAEFALRFMQDEDIPIVSQSLWGTEARRLRFWPASGRVVQRTMSQTAPSDIVVPAPKIADPNVVLF